MSNKTFLKILLKKIISQPVKHWLTYGYESRVNVLIVHYTKYGNMQNT